MAETARREHSHAWEDIVGARPEDVTAVLGRDEVVVTRVWELAVTYFSASGNNWRAMELASVSLDRDAGWAAASDSGAVLAEDGLYRQNASAHIEIEGKLTTGCASTGKEYTYLSVDGGCAKCSASPTGEVETIKSSSGTSWRRAFAEGAYSPAEATALGVAASGDDTLLSTSAAPRMYIYRSGSSSTPTISSDEGAVVRYVETLTVKRIH